MVSSRGHFGNTLRHLLLKSYTGPPTLRHRHTYIKHIIKTRWLKILDMCRSNHEDYSLIGQQPILLDVQAP